MSLLSLIPVHAIKYESYVIQFTAFPYIPCRLWSRVMGRMKLSCSLLGKVMINMINGSMQWTWVILVATLIIGI